MSASKPVKLIFDEYSLTLLRIPNDEPFIQYRVIAESELAEQIIKLPDAEKIKHLTTVHLGNSSTSPLGLVHESKHTLTFRLFATTTPTTLAEMKFLVDFFESSTFRRPMSVYSNVSFS